MHKKRCLSRLRSAVAPRLSNWRLLWKLLSLAQASPHFTKFTLRVTKRCGSHCLWHVSPSRQVVFHAFHVTDWAISMSDGTGDTGFTGRAVGQPNPSRSAQMLKDYLHCVSGSRSYHVRQRKNLRISMATVCQPLPLDQNPSPRHEKETSWPKSSQCRTLDHDVHPTPSFKDKTSCFTSGTNPLKRFNFYFFLHSIWFIFDSYKFIPFLGVLSSLFAGLLPKHTWLLARDANWTEAQVQLRPPMVGTTCWHWARCGNSFKGCENILISRFHSKQM